ncbi:hypothetical protein [Flavobacterium sp.]|uniref:hypothetical protein n=1 Tax=Flavobacterium sp. TaxID=239 RepID=UPI002623157A|nr:hypothetical protein [Flavobacterium sp.]
MTQEYNLWIEALTLCIQKVLVSKEELQDSMQKVFRCIEELKRIIQELKSRMQ